MDIFNQNTYKFEKVRCFLDRGSNRTFATKKCAERCGLNIIGSEFMYISAFGQSAKRTKVDIAKTTFYKNKNSMEDKISVNVLIKEKIVDNLCSFKLSMEEQKYIAENGIELADPEAASSGSLPIDMLLGQDCAHAITKGESIFLQGGLVLVPSWDNRFILAGSVDCTQDSRYTSSVAPHFLVSNTVCRQFPFYVEFKTPRKVQKLISRVLSCITNEDELEIVESFRALDALGIHPFEYEISPVLEEFDKNTTYDGKRYTVKLPFKDPQIKRLSNNFFQAFSRLMSGFKRRLKPKFAEEKEKYHQSFIEDLESGILERVECLGTISEINEKLALNPQYFNKIQVVDGKPCCYLPHQCVYKQSTGKFRRVNDAAARPHKGAYSLNDCLEKGPDLMGNILQILLGFRKNKWAAKADIEKAFPQVVIHPEYRDALRCLWYEGDKIWVYRFTRLPFGLSCSPMILAGVLQKHLSEKNVDEKTKQNFITSIYVDDSVWSEAFLKDLLDRKDLYTTLFQEAGMNFRDWTSNHPEARKLFGEAEGKDPPLEDKVLGMKWDIKNDKLSINSDKVKELKYQKLKTKRHLWKFVPSIYDPLGLVSPYVQVGKEIVSRACDEVKGWDSALPQNYIDEARSWALEFENFDEITFDRHVSVENPKNCKLIGCCDASTRAIGACVYLLSTQSDGSKVCNLVLAKNRLAPKVKHSIPRMELLSAVLLINVMKHVRVAYREIEDSDVFWFSDSADVIFWLYSGHLSWRPFVANQIKKIRKNSLVQNWRHIDSAENPADLPSRGTKLSELKNNSFWQHGPKFWLDNLNAGKSKLSGYDKHYQNLELSPSCKAELKKDLQNLIGMSACAISSVIENDYELLPQTKIDFKNNLENWEKVISMADIQLLTQDFLCNKAVLSVHNVKASVSENLPDSVCGYPRIDKIITNFDSLKRSNIFTTLKYDHLMEVTNNVLKAASILLGFVRRKPVHWDVHTNNPNQVSKSAETIWIRSIQEKYFPDLFKLAKNHKVQVAASSRSLFTKHAVFLDSDMGLLRCTTRNEHSDFEYSTVYPILLPSTIKGHSNNFENCKFSELLVEKAHVHCGHQGVPHTLAHLRSEFWIIKGRSFVQKFIHKCVACRKIQGPFYSVPSSPSLPEFRVIKSRPWRGTGLDYLGPFWCKEGKGKKYKVWFILYTCGATHNIHLEAVKSRNVQDFLDANSRFMDSEGIPLSFISDHEGAFKKGSLLYEQVAKSKHVKQELSKKRVSWNFYTEKSPNKGGFIERLNALVKKVVFKTLGKRIPTFEAFRTLAVHAKSVINDRPLTYLFSSLNSEYKALTPSMLLRGYNIGENSHLIRRNNEDEEEEKLGERYLYREKMKNSFWNYWYQCYIKNLFERHINQKKGQKEQLVPKIGEVVLVFGGERVPRRTWRMGKVVEIGEVKRGTIRQVTVQMLSPTGKILTKLNRPPEQLVPLEVDSSYEKLDPDLLASLEGDPRFEPTPWVQNPHSQKYDKKQLAFLKKSKIWPPYSVSHRFFYTSSKNTGPEQNFVSEIFQGRDSTRSFGPRKQVSFNMEEE